MYNSERGIKKNVENYFFFYYKIILHQSRPFV